MPDHPAAASGSPGEAAAPAARTASDVISAPGAPHAADPAPARPASARPDPVRPDPARPDPARPDPARPDPGRPAAVRPHRAAHPAYQLPPGPLERAGALLASVIRLVSRLAAAMLVLHVIFQVFHANPANGLVGFAGRLAGPLSLGLADLFLLDDPRWQAGVNHGLAALVWLAAGAALAGLLRRGH